MVGPARWLGKQPVVVGPEGVLPLPWLASALRESLSNARGHALLAHASPGNGALEFALVLAQSWLCEAVPAPTPAPKQSAALACGRCASCHLVQARLHADLLVLLPEEDRVRLGWRLATDRADAGDADGDASKVRKKASRQIRIDDVRAALDWVVNSNSRGRAKVLVIHPAEKLNPIAANALLKTLEEPPPGVRIVLTVTDPAQLLPTVRSRCQQLHVAAVPKQEGLSWLQSQGIEGAEVLLKAAGGEPLRAANMKSLGVTAALWSSVPGAMVQGNVGVFIAWPLPSVVDALQRLCHDAMRMAAGGEPRFFPAHGFPNGMSMGALATWRQELQRIARHDGHPWSEALLIESMVSEASAALTARAKLPAVLGRGVDTLPT